ncbi:hypothetical protein GBA52_024604 [Prunus armeniaca]|nr:hypothetical protein GBA52_024604 [Prunus armeniaca]
MLWLWLCVAVPFGPLASACVAIPWPCVALPFGPSASACVALPWPCFCSHSRHSDKVTCLTELTMACLALHTVCSHRPQKVPIQQMPKKCQFNACPRHAHSTDTPTSAYSKHAQGVSIQRMPKTYPLNRCPMHSQDMPIERMPKKCPWRAQQIVKTLKIKNIPKKTPECPLCDLNLGP